MTPLKSRQFCSVCKQWLEMAVVSTGDGDEDDGVIWFRCPQCQGYLPKLGGGDLTADEDGGNAGTADAATEKDGTAAAGTPSAQAAAPSDAGDDDMPWDSPAEMMAARDRTAAVADADDGDDDLAGDDDGDDEADAGGRDAPGTAGGAGEPLAEYAALLAALDPETATPYRPWETYEVGQGILHLAWDDCGVVVAKEDLPGGRKAIKCYFADAGVVRLIENAAR